MSALGQVGAAAWAAREEGRSDAIPGLHQEEVRDSQKASDRDFPSPMVAKEHLLSRTRRGVQVLRQAQPPQDAWQKAVCRTGLQAVPGQRVARVQKAVPLRALPALLQADAGELELVQARSLRGR